MKCFLFLCLSLAVLEADAGVGKALRCLNKLENNQTFFSLFFHSQDFFYIFWLIYSSVYASSLYAFNKTQPSVFDF